MPAVGEAANPVEAGFDEVSFTPRFQAQIEAARGTSFGLSHLYNKYQRALRFWTIASLFALAAVPLIVFASWRSSWWLLLALVSAAMAWVAAISYGTVARKRRQFLQPLAVAQAQDFLAKAASKIAGDGHRAANDEPPASSK